MLCYKLDNAPSLCREVLKAEIFAFLAIITHLVTVLWIKLLPQQVKQHVSAADVWLHAVLEHRVESLKLLTFIVLAAATRVDEVICETPVCHGVV